MPNKVQCSLSYHQASAEHLPVFGLGVKQGIKNNPTVFDPAKTPAPPVTDTQFETLIGNDEETYAAYKKGGSAQKPAYLAARSALITALDDTAVYVDTIANGDENIITLAGYTPTYVSKNKPTVPTAPKKVTAETGDSTGEMITECETFDKNCQYGCIVSEGQPLPAGIAITADGLLFLPAGLTNRIIFNLNRERVKKFTGLTKRVDYYFYYFVINAAGVSPLSEGVEKMSN